MLAAALFTTADVWTKLRCPPTCDWKKKICMTHTLTHTHVFSHMWNIYDVEVERFYEREEVKGEQEIDWSTCDRKAEPWVLRKIGGHQERQGMESGLKEAKLWCIGMKMSKLVSCILTKRLMKNYFVFDSNNCNNLQLQLIWNFPHVIYSGSCFCTFCVFESTNYVSGMLVYGPLWSPAWSKVFCREPMSTTSEFLGGINTTRYFKADFEGFGDVFQW